MGEVYRARDPRLGREVAIKVLPEAVRSDPDRLRRFEREARAVGILAHPNILTVHDVGSDGGVQFVVSELLEGQTLRGRMREGKVSVDEVLDYGLQIARGLVAAHERKIVHRDLKPENLFVTRSGVVKILDFGLAKVAGSSLPVDREAETASCDDTTEPGTLRGTVAYMSPEQLRGEIVDERSDVFSLAVVLYEMLGGRHPFRGRTPADTMSAVLNLPPLRLRDIEAAPPDGMMQLLLSCLAKDRRERPSAAELEQALARQRARPKSAQGVRLTETPASVRDIRTPWRRLRAAAPQVAVLSLVVAGVASLVAIAWVGRGGDDHRPAPDPPPSFSTFSHDYWRRELNGLPRVLSFDQPGAPLDGLLRRVAEMGGINLPVMPGTAGQVEGRYLELPWPDVLDSELKEHGLAWSYSDGAAMIAPPAELRRIWGTDLLVFSVAGAKAEAILATARTLLSDFGRAAILELEGARAPSSPRTARCTSSTLEWCSRAWD